MVRKLALIALLSAAPVPAQAAVAVFNFTGTITSDLVNSTTEQSNNSHVGQAFSGTFSYDPAVPPTISSGIQDLYYNAVTLSFTSPLGSASGTGYINRVYLQPEAFAFGLFTTGDFYVVSFGIDTPSSTQGMPLPSSLSGRHFSFGAEGATDIGLRSFAGQGTISDAATGVPEPATWGLMILGFGLVGAAMRYRSRGVRVGFA